MNVWTAPVLEEGPSGALPARRNTPHAVSGPAAARMKTGVAPEERQSLRTKADGRVAEDLRRPGATNQATTRAAVAETTDSLRPNSRPYSGRYPTAWRPTGTRPIAAAFLIESGQRGSEGPEATETSAAGRLAPGGRARRILVVRRKALPPGPALRRTRAAVREPFDRSAATQAPPAPRPAPVDPQVPTTTPVDGVVEGTSGSLLADRLRRRTAPNLNSARLSTLSTASSAIF